MMIPIVDALAQVAAAEPVELNDADQDHEQGENAPLAVPDDSSSAAAATETDPIVEFKVSNQGQNRPVVLQEMGKQPSKFFLSETQKKARVDRQRNLLLMAVAYAANIGGTGVITGSPPNLVVPQILETRFGDSTGLTFASWMAFAVPIVAVNLILSWLWLSYMAWRDEKRHMIPGEEDIDKKQKEAQIMKVIKQKYTNLGPIRCHELSALICFVIVMLLWFFRKPLFMPGWGDWFVFMTERGKKVTVGGATPAILLVLVVFALPTHYKFWPFQAWNKTPQSSPSLIDWKTVCIKLPWGVILLLGGGFALSDACVKSGLSKWLIDRLMILVGLPPWLINVIVCVTTVGLTQVRTYGRNNYFYTSRNLVRFISRWLRTPQRQMCCCPS